MSVFSLESELNNLDSEGIPSGMLSSPQIKIYINKGLLVLHALASNLNSATYDMRMGSPAYKFEQGRLFPTHLSAQRDVNKGIHDSYIIESNQLVFVTTIEEFNLPKDIIARFNLKSKLVHAGLLLGTGPIVDPEFHGRILIPIHNFRVSGH